MRYFLNPFRLTSYFCLWQQLSFPCHSMVLCCLRCFFFCYSLHSTCLVHSRSHSCLVRSLRALFQCKCNYVLNCVCICTFNSERRFIHSTLFERLITKHRCDCDSWGVWMIHFKSHILGPGYVSVYVRFPMLKCAFAQIDCIWICAVVFVVVVVVRLSLKIHWPNQISVSTHTKPNRLCRAKWNNK